MYGTGDVGLCPTHGLKVPCAAGGFESLTLKNKKSDPPCARAEEGVWGCPMAHFTFFSQSLQPSRGVLSAVTRHEKGACAREGEGVIKRRQSRIATRRPMSQGGGGMQMEFLLFLPCILFAFHLHIFLTSPSDGTQGTARQQTPTLACAAPP